jgi:pyruvate dehydrogenase E1 component
MANNTHTDDWNLEQAEWLEALEEVLEAHGRGKSAELFQALRSALARRGVANGGAALNTPYMNTIPADEQPEYPGDLAMETKIEQIIRWNAQAMVLHAQDKNLALGGHIATYAACATMLEVLFNHFLRKKSADYGGDLLMFQGHASPGVYARAVFEGRLPLQKIVDFRQETLGGVSSYPHPRRMPDFWQAPSVSMGLGPMTAIYQGRFMKYLENRGLKPENGGKIWHFIGDGEIDEPEIYGTIGLAARENLNNLVFVVHCNLQRLDGPVRGNGKIIQEVERHFFGASWDVIKVVWASEWDEILAKDIDGALLARMEAMVDGDFQELSNLDGAGVREMLVRGNDKIAKLLADISDDDLKKMRRGGHDAKKVYAAYERASRSEKPVAIIIKTTKGYGMGKAAEGKNKAHQTKDLSVDSRVETKNRYQIPISDDQAKAAEFYFPEKNAPETAYLLEKRKNLGGFLPERSTEHAPFNVPKLEIFTKQMEGNATRSVSTTGVMMDLLQTLMLDEKVGKYIVPIVPDEAQTFGMEPLFNKFHIWNQKGQLYTPLEIGMSVIKYKESRTGQVLQEGINEDGATASFTAAGTAYHLHGIPTVPFYIYYSMFGFQRVGDMVWAAADMMCRGFLLGATAGRTTLNGEGLQHQDGHSLLLAQTMPSVISYDPAMGYELAVIVQDGLRRMYTENESVIYYLTVYNENFLMAAMPKGVEDGIKKGIYRFKTSENKSKKGLKAHLLGSGSIFHEALKAAELLENEGISTDVWSVTSWTELARDGEKTDRHNFLNPTKTPQISYLEQALKGETGVFVATSDWMKLTASQLDRFIPGDFHALGTDGFGLSESRASLRDYFEISAKFTALAALRLLQKQGSVSEKIVVDFVKKQAIDGGKLDPMGV